MTEDGTAEYTYDAENRLIKVVKSVAGNTEVQYTYDYMGRRVRSKSFYYGNPNGDIKYVFDGWLAVAELNGSISDQFVRAYTWGQDLSGSRDGAGGVGGLLSMTRADGVDYGYFYDANGNVTQVVRLTDGQVSAKYKYDPFGNSIGQFDSINNPFRFSTKAFDYLTQLYYSGYRYYSPRLGRWITRDPIEEMGGRNLFGFVENNPLNQIDLNGQFAFVVIPIGIGIGITVDALVLGINKINVNYQGYKNNDSFCCNLRSAAENCGLDLDSQMIDSYPKWYRDPKVKLKTYLYCTYCIECSFAEISKVTMELSKTLI